MTRDKKAASLSFALITCFVLSIVSQTSDAFQYDIWFKYPHPYTVTPPITYCPQDVAATSNGQCQSQLQVFVNTLDSPKTLIPYTFTQLLDFCKLSEAKEMESMQHTEWDDNIRLAPFDIKFLRNEECKILCKKTYNLKTHLDLYRLEEMKLGLTRDYYHHWFADTFPFSWCYKKSSALLTPTTNPLAALNSNSVGKECFIGFPIGYSTDERGLPEDERIPIANFTKPNALFLFNHFEFTIFYEWISAGKTNNLQAGRITALRITPRSIDHNAQQQTQTNVQQSTNANNSRCGYSQLPMEVPAPYQYGLNQSIQISYSYSVQFVEDEPSASWSQRWQRLEATLPGTWRGKWILLLVIILLIATALPAAYAIARTIFSERRLICVNPSDTSNDECAWRQLAGDIFREPRHIALFSVLVGSGCQFIASVLLSEFFSAFVSFFSTTILVLVVVLFVVAHGFVGGYVAVRLYRTFGGDNWRSICCFVTLLNPLVIFCMLVMSRNLLLLYNGSLMALPLGLFGSLVMTSVCFGFSIPATLTGGSFAFKTTSIDFPVRPTANERQLPEQLIWRQPFWTTLAIGLVPLICFWSVEAYPFYDSGGYFITVITILIVICLSISHCYFHLSQYDYRWWWRSYLACGVAAIYYFLHCIYYIFSNLFIDTLANAILYVSFAFFVCLALFLLTGTIGFVVTYVYLWQTYSRAIASPDMNYAMFQKSSQLE